MNALGIMMEMVGKFAGPLSPSEFMQIFLPFEKGELKAMPRRKKAIFQSVADQKAETAMYAAVTLWDVLFTLHIMHLYESSRLRGWSLAMTVLAAI